MHHPFEQCPFKLNVRHSKQNEQGIHLRDLSAMKSLPRNAQKFAADVELKVLGQILYSE
jgi:hypothetical protein